MNQFIKAENIDLKALIQKDSSVSINFKSKILDILNDNFTKDEQQWYIANLYIYLNYHPTTDFPINLENVYKLVGFTTKANAKRTLVNNFTINQDYKTLLINEQKEVLPIIEKKSKLGGRPDGKPVFRKDDGKFANETIMLNTNTFKGLCMLVKTEKAKKIRNYYIKLETIFNKIVNEERLEFEQQVKLLENKVEKEEIKVKLLTNKVEKEEIKVKLLTNKVEDTLKNSFHKRCIVYLIKIFLENNEIIYKFGLTDDIVTRLRTHKLQIGENIELIFCIESNDNKLPPKLPLASSLRSQLQIIFIN